MGYGLWGTGYGVWGMVYVVCSMGMGYGVVSDSGFEQPRQVFSFACSPFHGSQAPDPSPSTAFRVRPTLPM